MKNFITPEMVEKLRYGQFRTSCDCGCLVNDVTIWLEQEEYDHAVVYLDMTVIRHARCYSCKWRFWKSLKERITTSCRFLFTGWIEMNGGTVFNDANHLRDFAKTMLHLADEMEK